MAIRVAEAVGLVALASTFALTVRWFAGRVAAYLASSGSPHLAVRIAARHADSAYSAEVSISAK